LRWNNYTIGEICEFVRNGKSIKQRKDAGGLPITRIETISFEEINPLKVGFANISKGDYPDYLLQSGDILFSHINSIPHIGKTAIFEGKPQNLIHGMNLLCLRAKNEIILPKYFLYLLRSLNFRAKLMRFVNKSVNQASVSTRNLKNINISLPPLPEQKRIAAILDKADALRQKRKKALQKLDDLLQSVFLEMFGDPVRNEKGWEVVKLGDYVNHVSSGSTPKGGSSVYVDEGIVFIRSQNVLMLDSDFSDVAHITENIHEKMTRTWVKMNDVLLNITGASIGRVTYFEGENDSANVNQHVCIIRPNDNVLNHKYLTYHLAYPSYQAKILGENKGATRQAFNFTQIKDFNLMLPPIEFQQRFGKIENKFKILRDKSFANLEGIDNLFHSLQQLAFRGELSWAGAEELSDKMEGG
jgi:type I restriction enzyme, S subunit